jgi:hypothetical protein
MIAFPDVNHNPKIADWVELYITYNNRPLSKATLIKEIQKEASDLTYDDIEPIADTVFMELIQRVKFYGPACPYQINGNTATPKFKWSDFPEHTMCLIFSLYGVIKTKGNNDGTKYFEQVSNVAIKSFYNCDTMVLGFPNKSNLVGQVGEFIKRSLEIQGHKSPRPKDKDKGVDIIAWKSFEDNRNNQLIMFIQCGAGYHFGQKKPIDITGWRRIIDFRVDPMTGIAIPGLVNDNNTWEDLSNVYKIVFDRPRIIKNLFGSPYVDNDLRKKLKTWCRKRLN